MRTLIASLIAVAGLSAGADAQLIKCLVSGDGVNFGSSVVGDAGSTIQVLIVASYTGTSTTVAGFGSANFQPTIQNWRPDDVLLPIRQGDNSDGGSGIVQPQFYTGISAGDGPHVSAGYVPGTNGRVYPMGRSTLAGSNALQGFVHHNPVGNGQDYLRIAQANNPAWIGAPGNTTGTGGVDVSQIYVAGRTTSDPDFWGNREVNLDPDFGWTQSGRVPANDSRRLNVELFRFSIILSDEYLQQRVVDVPLAGQQMDGSGHPYVGYFSNPNSATPDLQFAAVVQTATIQADIGLAPASFGSLAFAGLFATRRRRR